MKVLLSIKPQFAEKIFDGTKKYEFRKSIFKNKDIRTIVVYASYPVQKVIGEFEIEDIISDEISALWKKTKKYAGIDEVYFLEYFNQKTQGYAIKVKSPKRYKKPLDLAKAYNTAPPQSFSYL